ncbi:MAG: hypothetical protein ABIT05_03665 [Chitinophagaceae bacterium]
MERETIASPDLSTLDKTQLVDLLQNRTQLLVTAITLKVPDRNYIEALTQEVKDIQEAIRLYQG